MYKAFSVGGVKKINNLLRLVGATGFEPVTYAL